MYFVVYVRRRGGSFLNHHHHHFFDKWLVSCLLQCNELWTCLFDSRLNDDLVCITAAPGWNVRFVLNKWTTSNLDQRGGPVFFWKPVKITHTHTWAGKLQLLRRWHSCSFSCVHEWTTKRWMNGCSHYAVRRKVRCNHFSRSLSLQQPVWGNIIISSFRFVSVFVNEQILRCFPDWLTEWPCVGIFFGCQIKIKCGDNFRSSFVCVCLPTNVHTSSQTMRLELQNRLLCCQRAFVCMCACAKLVDCATVFRCSSRVH